MELIERSMDMLIVRMVR